MKNFFYTLAVVTAAGAAYVAGAYAGWRGVVLIERKYPSGLLTKTQAKPDLRSVN